jgi:heme exporter protein C
MRTVGPGLLAALAVAAVGFLTVPMLILSAPVEPVMGLVQKIFYFHVPCATMMFLSTFAAAAGSIAFLFKGSERGDRLALAAGELGVLFGACTLVTGPLWGRKAWGVWWQWDARLTSSLLLFLILNGYLLARRYGGPGGRKLAAALALFAAVDVPLVYKSVDIWRTVHPQTTVVRTLDPGMRPAFWASFALMLLMWGILLTVRLRLERARATVADLELLAQDRDDDRDDRRGDHFHMEEQRT